MSSFRCSDCGVSWWGSLVEKAKCPDCLGKVDSLDSDPTEPYDEQKSRKRHADFRRYCDERDAKQVEELSSIPVLEDG